MPLRPLLTAGLLGSLASFTSYAQTAPGTSRFYVGVGANLLSNVPFKDYGIVPRLFGPSLTIGGQVTPRLAGQVGLSYHWTKDSYPTQVVDQTGYTVGNFVYQSRYFIVPVLLRYTVTVPAERFHFDILGGATLVHARSKSTFEYLSGSNPTYNPELSTLSDTRFNLTLGPAVRAAIASHLELTAAGLMSMVVGENYYRFSDRLFLNTSLGINYTFN